MLVAASAVVMIADGACGLVVASSSGPLACTDVPMSYTPAAACEIGRDVSRMYCVLHSKWRNVTHCVRPIQNWIQERVRGVSGHQVRPKAFPMAHMNHMVI